MPPGIGYTNPAAILQAAQKVSANRRPSGLSAFLQAPGTQELLLGLGSSLLAQSDQPGTIGGALGRSIPGAVQARQSAIQQHETDQALGALSPEQQQLLKLLPQAQRGGAAFGMQTQPRPEQKFLEGVEGQFLTPDGQGGLREVVGAPEPEPEGTDNDTAMNAGLNSVGLPNDTDVAALDPATRQEVLRFAQEYRRSGATTVNVGEETQDFLIELDQQDLRQAREGRTGLTTEIRTYDRMLDILDDIPEGALAPALLRVGQIGASIGLDIVDGASEAEVFKALSNQLAISKRNPAGGAGLPGQMSDKDVDFLQAMVPGLENTAEGNRLLIEYNRDVASHLLALGAAKEEYYRQNGSLRGWSDKDWAELNPIFNVRDAPF